MECVSNSFSQLTLTAPSRGSLRLHLRSKRTAEDVGPYNRDMFYL